jgi:pilus assembly protein CpaF
MAEMSPDVDSQDAEQVRRVLRRLFENVLREKQLVLSRRDRRELFERIVADVLGLGPIEPLLHDETITEVLVNGPDMVFIERNGRLEETGIRFRDTEEILHVIDRIVGPLGRRVDESSPMVDARLPDGSRVNVIIPPLSLDGPCISIRKFSRAAYGASDLIRLGSVTRELVDFLKACVLARLNIIISGGTSTGKTTLLNMLSKYLPSDERILTIEDAAELQLQQRHVIRLEYRPPNVEGKGEVTIRQLVINALRMRPDRIVVGEVRGGEALDMLQAMNTGHDGSLTTAHSNSPRDTLHRIETMTLMAGMDLPLRAIREQMASAIDLIVHLARLADGSRKVVKVTEVQGMEGDVIVTQDIFQFKQKGIEDGRVISSLEGLGIRPRFMEQINAAGLELPADIFAPARENPW